MASWQNTLSPAKGIHGVIKGFQHEEEEPDYIMNQMTLLAWGILVSKWIS